jgi:hypothetical protein
MNLELANKALIIVGWMTFIGPLVLWPITSLTVFRGEPQGVLGLSWLAIILSGATLLLQAVTKRHVDEPVR